MSKNELNLLGMDELVSMADGDLDFILNIFNIYLVNVEMESSNFKNALNENDNDTIIQIVHKLRPSFELFEFTKLYDLSSQIEVNGSTEENSAEFINLLDASTSNIEEKIKLLNV